MDCRRLGHVHWLLHILTYFPVDHDFNKQYQIVCADPEFCELVSKDGFWLVGETSTPLLNEYVSILF